MFEWLTSKSTTSTFLLDMASCSADSPLVNTKHPTPPATTIEKNNDEAVKQHEQVRTCSTLFHSLYIKREAGSREHAAEYHNTTALEIKKMKKTLPPPSQQKLLLPPPWHILPDVNRVYVRAPLQHHPYECNRPHPTGHLGKEGVPLRVLCVEAVEDHTSETLTVVERVHPRRVSCRVGRQSEQGNPARARQKSWSVDGAGGGDAPRCVSPQFSRCQG